ncbi:MAG: radical SAM protein [Desulfovibrionales bacterium]|nr:radical SAM protein [Desulfovibrionales bacterium]
MVGTVGSVCPECLGRVEAELVEDGDVVRMVKRCPEHGGFSAVVWRGEPAFSSWVRPKIPFGGGPREAVGKGCPYDCGLCARHAQRTCTALVEITSRCNLGCPVCFADSGGPGTEPQREVLARMFDQVMARTGGCNLQLSGGEPTVREDLPQIVAMAKRAGFAFVQLNTNGLRLAEDPGLVEALASAGLSSVFLQFDGVRDAVYRALRGRDLLEVKGRAVDNAAAAGLGIVLVPTVARGVNTDQLWDIVLYGLARQPFIRGVHFQPMSYFGRYPADFIPDHVTLPELMTGLAQQSGGMVKVSDFLPPGCEHALCSFSGKYMTREDGSFVRLGNVVCDCTPRPAEAGALKSINVTARQWSAPATPGPPSPPSPFQGPGADGPIPPTPQDNDLDRFLARARTHTFTISAMAFQDAWSLNLDRLQGCCIHVAQPNGRLVPFCAFNLTSRHGRSLYRGRM